MVKITVWWLEHMVIFYPRNLLWSTDSHGFVVPAVVNVDSSHDTWLNIETAAWLRVELLYCPA